jgi:anti-sigma regulatory factor (Ser/Thr protein kinase)
MTKTEPIMRLTLRDEPGATRKLRSALARAAASCGLTRDDTFDLQVAATEAVTNALRGTGETAAVTVVAGRREDALEVEVAHAGGFRPPSLTAAFEAEGGRGIPLMLALVDELEFAATGDGTRVRMRKRLPRTAGS